MARSVNGDQAAPRAGSMPGPRDEAVQGTKGFLSAVTVPCTATICGFHSLLSHEHAQLYNMLIKTETKSKGIATTRLLLVKWFVAILRPHVAQARRKYLKHEM